MPTREDLNELLQRVAGGDRAAFAALFKHFAPRLKSYLMRLGTEAGVAEELAQEAMVNVWRRASSFDPARAAASTWVFTIVRNLRIDHLRRADAPTVESVDDGGGLPNPWADDAGESFDGASPETLLDAARRESAVREALLRLPPEQASILRLCYFDEHPHASIARELRLPLGTVKSRIRLAVGHLRRLLNQFEP